MQPAPDRWDDSALDFYREMLKGMRELGLTPWSRCTILPIRYGSMKSADGRMIKRPRYFEQFVRKVVSAFKDEVKLWVTINEPNGLVVNSYMDGMFSPWKEGL